MQYFKHMTNMERLDILGRTSENIYIAERVRMIKKELT